MKAEIKNRYFTIYLFIIVLLGLIMFPAQVYAITDREGPEVTNVTMDKTEVQPGDTITITADATDESDIDYIEIMFYSGNVPICPRFTHVEGNHYEAVINITENTINGEYVFNNITARDSLNNHSYNRSYTDLKFTVTGGISDKEGPEVTNVTMDKTEVKPGDTITITADATDETGIDYIEIMFYSGNVPICPRFTHVEGNHYEAVINITENTINGEYVFNNITARDSLNNHSYNRSYTDLKFTVSGGISDREGPEVTNVTMDKTEVQPGDTITITADATDESSIDYIEIMFYSGNVPICPRFTHVEGNHYEAVIDITENTIEGEYVFNNITARDSLNNHSYNRSYTDLKFTVYSQDDYEQYSAINPLEGVYTITSNKTLSDTSIDGDLYIAPNSIATLNNVTINGDVYVLGTLRANSIIANTLYARSMTWGGTAYGNGAASMSGSNSVQSMRVGDGVITDIPVRIDSDLLSVDGKLSVKGAYANIATMYVNDNQVNATSSGKFYLNDINIGDTTSISIKFVTAEGETFTKDYDIVVGTLDKDGKPNGIPIITANDISICEGDALDILDGVRASDHEDGDISNNVVASPSTLSTSKPGEYDVQFSVTDSQGTETTKTIRVEIKSHEWDTGTVVTDATCTKDGQKKYVCANCNKEKTEVIPATGHSFSDEFTTDTEPTCTTEGSKSKHCSKCDAVTEVTAILANGHTFGPWEVVTPSTCEGAGSHQHSCEVCGFTEAEVTDPTGHDIKDNYTIDVPATCTTDGSQSKHCKNCEVTFESQVIPATGHNYGDWKTTLEPTCKEEGSKEKVCSNCGDKVTEDIPALGHAWNEEPTIDKAATCTDSGSQSIHCARCNETKDTEVTPALGHDWNNTVTVEKAATCTEDGSESIHCSRCDAIQEGTEKVIPKTGHKFTAWKTTKAATEIAAGQKTRTCSECGHVEKQTMSMLKPTLPAVKIAAPKAAKKAATVKWKKVSKKNQKKIAKIEIQYSMDKSFKTGVKTVYAKRSAASKKITKLTSKKTYYVRIRAYKKSGGAVHVSKWSAVKKVKAK